MTNKGADPQDARYVIYVCDDCGYRLPHPSVLRSIPWCPRCGVSLGKRAYQ